MIKKLKKRIALALAGVMILGSFSPVFATVDEKQTTSTSETLATDVLYNQDSTFMVTVPKKVTLENDKTSIYEVTVEGDIASNEIVSVVPEESFQMIDQATAGTAKEPVIATVEQDKTTWKFNEFETLGNGNIEALGLSSGSWRGTFWFNIELLDESEIINLTLSADLLQMGLNNSVQVDAFVNGENVNDIVTWESDNENITAENGLVKTKASAQVGDEAIVTVSVPQISTFSVEPTNEVLAQATFKVVIVDMLFTEENNNETIISIDIKPGESKTVEVNIIPDSVIGSVSWTTTAPAGISLIKDGNKVTIEVAEDMPIGNTYDLIASYGDYSKLLKINIVPDHVHEYSSSITTKPGCNTAGEKTYSCTCGDSYTESIEATGHSYVNGICTGCGTKCQHSYTSKVTQQATCKATGVKTFTCSKCSHTYTETIPVGEHIMSGDTCTVCGATTINGKVISSGGNTSGNNLKTSDGDTYVGSSIAQATEAEHYFGTKKTPIKILSNGGSITVSGYYAYDYGSGSVHSQPRLYKKSGSSWTLVQSGTKTQYLTEDDYTSGKKNYTFTITESGEYAVCLWFKNFNGKISGLMYGWSKVTYSTSGN